MTVRSLYRPPGRRRRAVGRHRRAGQRQRGHGQSGPQRKAGGRRRDPPVGVGRAGHDRCPAAHADPTTQRRAHRNDHPELDNPIFPAYAQTIERLLALHGYTPVLCTQMYGGTIEDEFTAMLVERGVDGIIFVSGPVEWSFMWTVV